MFSTPPATNASPSPALIACAALAIACSPEPQRRLTVCPGTSIGRPASNAAMRATLRLSSPAWFVQPRITSSIDPGSTAARSTAPRTTRAARSSARMLARAPPARPNGVRTPDTMNASVMSWLVESHVFEIERLTVDPRARRRNPVRELAWLDDATGHQRLHEGVILLAWQPPASARVPCVLVHDLAVRPDVVSCKAAN